MGHLVGKDVYRQVGSKIDNLHVRAPWNEAFHSVIKDLFSVAEADLFVKLPYLWSSLDRVAKITRMSKQKLEPLLKRLCEKGLVMDFMLEGEYRYMPSPLFVGVFEFTMMRTRGKLNSKEWGKWFYEYMHDGAPYRANFDDDTRSTLARVVPHNEIVGEHVEVLDYEKVNHLLEETYRCAIGLCSCRHKKDHTVGDRCDVPLETCVTLGHGADYLIRNDLSRELSKSEMLDIFQRSRELGLVFCADNVKQRVTFICQCCGCCCGILDGLNVHGLYNTLVTSTVIAHIDDSKCNGCGKCSRACPIAAIAIKPVPKSSRDTRKRKPIVDREFCLGCGVCGLKCDTGALRLVKREQRVIHPENTFERVVLQCLERGTLQNQLFDNPQSMTQAMMRPVLGAFLKLKPVQKTLMSDMLRSTFLNSLAGGMTALGKGYLHEL